MLGTCIILKSRKRYSAIKTVADIEKSAEFLGLELIKNSHVDKLDKNKDMDGTIMLGHKYYDQVSEKDEDGFYAYNVYSELSILEENENTAFNWINENEEIRYVADIQYILGTEDILLKLIYKYLEKNPNDYIWFEDEWVYSIKDIEKIINQRPDNEWCYKKIVKN